MKRHPPRMAVRLLGYLTSDEALVGDLVEEVARGRSAWWCWRQVAAAVPAGAWRDICRHSVLACRALLVGWVLLGVAFAFVVPRFRELDEWLFVTGLADVRAWWPAHHAVWFVVSALTFAKVGWAVGRFHGPSMVLLFFASVLALDASRLVWLMATTPWNAADLVAGVGAAAALRLPILVGGVWGARRRTGRGNDRFGLNEGVA